jgi:hypothetical protein
MSARVTAAAPLSDARLAEIEYYLDFRKRLSTVDMPPTTYVSELLREVRRLREHGHHFADVLAARNVFGMVASQCVATAAEYRKGFGPRPEKPEAPH